MGGGGVPNELGTSLFALARPLKMRQIVHGDRTPTAGCYEEIHLQPILGVFTQAAEIRYLVAYHIQDHRIDGEFFTNQQNNGRPKVLLSLRMVWNTWSMLGDDILDCIRLEPSRGSYSPPWTLGME